MNKVVTFKVVEFETEKIFELDGLYFDKLQAYVWFEGGQLFVCRGGELIDETSGICEVGNHAEHTAFTDLECAGGEWSETRAIYPDMFQIGDVLVLEFPCEKDFDFKDFLKRNYIGDRVFRASLQKMPEGKLSELFTVVDEEIKRLLSTGARETNVLRFPC